jgi:hypothetical protein
MNLSECICGLRSMLDNAEVEIKSLENGRKASSARARKSLQNIKNSCHNLRKAVTLHTKALPTKTRVKNVVEPEPVVVEPEPEPEPVEEVKPVKPKKVRKTRVKENGM